MASNQFRFEPAGHRYFIGAAPVPSITQILNGAGLVPVIPQWTPAVRERGRRLHRDTATRDLTGHWPELLVQTDLPRRVAYEQFLHDAAPVYAEIEQPRYSKLFKYAGTPDRIGGFDPARFRVPGVPIVGIGFAIDLKCGEPLAHHGIQTAAQVVLVDGRRPSQAGSVVWPRLRYTLHLRADGTYRLVRWGNLQDFSGWWRALSQARLTAEGDSDDGKDD